MRTPSRTQSQTQRDNTTMKLGWGDGEILYNTLSIDSKVVHTCTYTRTLSICVCSTRSQFKPLPRDLIYQSSACRSWAQAMAARTSTNIILIKLPVRPNRMFIVCIKTFGKWISVTVRIMRALNQCNDVRVVNAYSTKKKYVPLHCFHRNSRTFSLYRSVGECERESVHDCEEKWDCRLWAELFGMCGGLFS